MVIQKREANAPLTICVSLPLSLLNHSKSSHKECFSNYEWEKHIIHTSESMSHCLITVHKENSFTIPLCLSFSDNWLIKHCNNNSKNNNKYKFKPLITLILFISDFHINDHSPWTCEVSFFLKFEKCLGCKCLASIVKISFYRRAKWTGIAVALSVKPNPQSQ